MRILRMAALLAVLIGASACAEWNNQGGLMDRAMDKVMPADSKKMALLRAEIVMVFLSSVAANTGERTSAEKMGAISAMRRVALEIDCLRAGGGGSVTLSNDDRASCGNVRNLYFFDLQMLSINRGLLALARTSLPDANLHKLLAAVPNASTQPLAVVSAALSASADVLSMSAEGFATWRDAVELVVEAYCDAFDKGKLDKGKERPPVCTDINDGRNVAEQRKFVFEVIATDPGRYQLSPLSGHFDAARAITMKNCRSLRSKLDAADQSVISCGAASGS